MSSTRKAPEHIIPAYSLLPEGADTEAAAAEAAQPAQAAEAAQSTQAAEAAPGRVEAAPEAARAAVAAAAAAVYGLDLCVFSRLGHRLPTIKAPRRYIRAVGPRAHQRCFSRSGLYWAAH
jgi:hypothetical protein